MADPTSEATWYAQLTAMQDAIAALKESLPTSPSNYEADLGLTDDDFSLPASASDRDSIFDDADGGYDSFTDDDERDGYSGQAGQAGQAGLFDQNWLRMLCVNFCSRKQHLAPHELETNIMHLLESNNGDEQLSGLLADVFGYDDLDLVMLVLQHRKEILISKEKEMRMEQEQELGGAEDVMLRLMTKEQRDEALRIADLEHKMKPLGPKLADKSENYPHIYRAYAAGNTMSSFGTKYSLPVGSTETQEDKYTEIKIPPTKVGTVRAGEKLVLIKEMDNLCQKTFKGYKSLNRMQSLVYPVAYQTNENMLICAPTGAGKTDAALLTMLRTISLNCEPKPWEEPDAEGYYCEKNDFKIVYVAPMKALAAEIVEKMGKRLAWLGIEVRELTGDMHLTKAEIVKTQIIVTTPEKWDVITRKSVGDTELVAKVKLLIFDEVHMLHDERGAVIESLVARTQRQVEATQSMIRIVGLSATLPNYVDVAEFLMVNPMAGLFYFDGSFRPVPLEQHFIGVKGKPNTRTSQENLDKAMYDKVKEMLLENHQVMVFVHSRKDTVKTALALHQMAMDDDSADLFDNKNHEKFEWAKREMNSSKGRELRSLFEKGMGVHHAGMLRSDRNLVEKIFSCGAMRVLCCTATLAWGVNLPAAAVVIKGTQVYDSKKGAFGDLGILDVLQIFGRAGRPQFQEYGIGFIITTQDKLAHYLAAVTQQIPIESRLVERIIDNLNAEIVLGTVTTITEAVQWLGYSYLFVRWKKNPMHYGISWEEYAEDPTLSGKRRELIIRAARRLQQTQMIIFDERTETLQPKDIGRIASNFYISNNSIEIFNQMMKPNATEADVLVMISLSSEFDQIQSRDSDIRELERLKREACHCQVPEKKKDETTVKVKVSGPEEKDEKGGKGGKGKDKGPDISSHSKVNILLQSYISKANIEDFALVSDSGYVSQNAGRICRALFQIAMNRRWGNLCEVLLSLSKSIEKRLWPFQHPLSQFPLPIHIIQKLEEKESTTSIEALRDMEVGEISSLVNNQRMGPEIAKALDNFPTLNVDCEIAPLNRDVLRVKLYLTAEFKWFDRVHGSSEGYWIWVENSDTAEIYHSEYFILSRKKLFEDHELNFTIPLADPLPSQIYVRAISDRWLGAETVTPVSFQHLIRPDTETIYTPLLNLQPLPITALKNPKVEAIYGQKFKYFNPMQTQIFHTLYHTEHNVLLGSPTGSGKTIACELAMWQAFRDHPGSKVVYIAPMKALVRERVKDWNSKLTKPLGLKLVELTGDNTPDTRTIRDADIIITTPEKWDGISRSWQTRSYVRQVSLVIIDEIHLLGGDRGPILEIIVSRMNYIASQSDSKVRLMGMSTAAANAQDLANWLGVKEGLYNFQHSVRPVPLEIYIDGFAEQTGFCALMQSMNRPSFLAIKQHSPTKPVIIFVASRRQTRLTSRDLIQFCGMEDNPRRFLHMEEDELQQVLYKVKDENLREALQFGIGLHHAGLVEADRNIAEELYLNNKIQILVATATLAWGVNLPAHLVVVKGTQFYDAKIEGYRDMDLTDVLQMLGRAGRPQFDTSGIAKIFTQESKKSFYKYFLHRGFPVESSLHKVVDDHLGAEVSAGTITTKQDALDYLTWTFFFRRLHKNPTYYGLQIPAEEQDSLSAQDEANRYLINIVNTSMSALAESGCILSHNNGDVDPTPLGKIASYYYLSHKTIRSLLSRAKRNATFAEVLQWMSVATEYDELPVRHNEDLLNIELSKHLPIPADGFGTPMWDPHVKAFLLIQCFLEREALPITDYIGDQNSVLDQAIRIIQASIDVLAELGYLSSAKMMVSLMAGIKQARWRADGLLSQLPGVDVTKARGKNITVSELVEMSQKDLENLSRDLGVSHDDKPGFMKIATTLPDVELQVLSQSSTHLTVQVTRRNNPHNKDWKVHAPLFQKPQQEGWFLILGDKKRDEVLALKRVSWPSGQRGVVGGQGGQGGQGRGGRSGRNGRGEPRQASGIGRGQPRLGNENQGGQQPSGQNQGQPRGGVDLPISARTTVVKLDLPEGLDQDATIWLGSDAYIDVEIELDVRLNTMKVERPRIEGGEIQEMERGLKEGGWADEVDDDEGEW